MTNHTPMIPFGKHNRLEIDHMIHGRKIRVSALVLILLSACFAAAGCPKPPVRQISDARAAVERARDERADLYASESLRKAEEFLSRAEEEMDAGRNRNAKGLSLNARKRAERSLEIAVPKREEAREGVRERIDKALALLDEAEHQDAVSLAPDKINEATEALAESERAFSERDYIRSAERVADAMVSLDAALRLCAEDAARKAAEEEERRKTEAPVLPKTHTVKRGESLWLISGYTEVYNDPVMWRLIYTANRDQIKDWGFIYPGQILTIQREATPEQVREARRLAGAEPPFTPPDDANIPY